MGGAQNASLTEQTSFAENPAEHSINLPGSVYFGVAPKSAASIISLDVFGGNIDRFISVTSFQNADYKKTFAFFGFSKDSLSAGVSKKFLGGLTTGLYYNGNIVDKIFAYISNNPASEGSTGVIASDNFTGIDYGFFGDVKGKNNINSSNNINLMFGAGLFGLDIGYSQKLYGRVERSTAEPHRVGLTDDAYFDNSTNAILDNALAPHIDMGFRFDFARAVFKTTLGMQVDIHQRRELNKGERITIADYYTGTLGTTTASNVTNKLAADYIEPAAALRFELDFNVDENAYIGLALETAGSMRFYSNMDDRGETVEGIFWSGESGTAYTTSVTERPLNLEVLARPSVRYITAIGKAMHIGLSGGFGMGFRFGSSETKTWTWANKADYAAASAPYDDNSVVSTVKEIPAVDLALYPNLGIGFSYEVIPQTFVLNGGVGAAQELYRLRTGEKETTVGGIALTTPVYEQTWGEPLAQLALGASFSFKKKYTLDAVFTSNGTSFDNSSFVLQFSAQF